MIDPISDLIHLIAINVRGIKSNIDFLLYLINQYSSPLILCISEHWLHSYEASYLSKAFPKFKFLIETIHEEHCFAPRLVRGRSGVAILWDSCLDPIISPVLSPRNDRVVGIRINHSPADLSYFLYIFHAGLVVLTALK